MPTFPRPSLLAPLVLLAAGCATSTFPAAQSSPTTESAAESAAASGSSGSGQQDTGSDSADDTSSVLDPAPLTGTIGTGRPSFGTGTTPVPVGRLQLESGYLYTEDGEAKSHAFPNLLLRYGVYDGIELRAAWGGAVLPEGGEDGTTDIRLGAKLAIRKQDGAIPAMAFQPSFTVPTGSASTADGIDPQVQFPLAWSVGDKLSLLANLNLGTASFNLGPGLGDANRPTYAQSLLAGYSLTDRLSVFVEYFGVNTIDRRETHNADAGVLFLLDDNTQIDFVIGAGLNDQADDFFVGAGYSFRL